jgi:DNA polymerase III epsilon subunit family exonuclease
MSKLDRTNFFVVDVETTGANSKTDRLTDIAVVHVLGGEIIDTFHSLINPRQPIPEFIQEMTGITNELVRNAPDEREVLPEYKEFISKDNSIFVAHNANFDHFFIRNTMIRNYGASLEHEILCTVKLARKILPKSQKVNLTSLAQYFNIPIFMRHRALGDAFATAKALIKMLDILEVEYGITTRKELNEFERKTRRRFKVSDEKRNHLLKLFENSPSSQGVYYLYDDDGNRIYADKADNINHKLITFLDPNYLSSSRMKEILELTASVEYFDTPSELHSDLKLGKNHNEYPLELFNHNNQIENHSNLVYIDTNNRLGKTVGLFLIKDGLLANHLEIGTSASTFIVESAIEDTYYNPSKLVGSDNDRIIVRKWLSKEPDLGNKIIVNGDKSLLMREIKNYISSCY